MKLWTISPAYLDHHSLVVLWKNALIAQAILSEHGSSRNHKELQKFYSCRYPLYAIGHYLTSIFEEAAYRHYRFDSSKIIHFYEADPNILFVDKDDLFYEFCLLQKELMKHDNNKWKENFRVFESDLTIHSHPLFITIDTHDNKLTRCYRKVEIA